MVTDAHGAEKIGEAVDLAPLDHDGVEGLALDRGERLVGAAHNFGRDLQLVQDGARNPQKCHVGAQQMSLQVEFRSLGVFDGALRRTSTTSSIGGHVLKLNPRATQERMGWLPPFARAIKVPRTVARVPSCRTRSIV